MLPTWNSPIGVEGKVSQTVYRQMRQLSWSGLGNRSGSAVTVMQGALQLRNLHEDTTGPGQGMDGGEHLLSWMSTQLASATCHTIYNPPASGKSLCQQVISMMTHCARFTNFSLAYTYIIQRMWRQWEMGSQNGWYVHCSDRLLSRPLWCMFSAASHVGSHLQFRIVSPWDPLPNTTR